MQLFVSGTHANSVYRAGFCRTSATDTHPRSWVWALGRALCHCLCCTVSSQHQINIGPIHTWVLSLLIQADQFRSYLLTRLLKARFKQSFWNGAGCIFTPSLLANKTGSDFASAKFKSLDDSMWFFHLSFSRASSLCLAYQKILGATRKVTKGTDTSPRVEIQDTNSNIGRVLRTISSLNVKHLSCR